MLNWCGFGFEYRSECVARRLAFERLASREHFVHHGAQTENVRTIVDDETARLFGGHVPSRAQNEACPGAYLYRRRFGGCDTRCSSLNFASPKSRIFT